MFRFSALRCFGAIFFFFFIRSDQTKRCDLCLGPNPCPFLPSLPNSSQSGSCAPYIEGDQLFTLLPPWKKKQKLCFFATDLATWNSSHYPFLGLKLLSLKVPSHSCFVSDSAGEILNSLCTKLFKFYIILKLCFFGVGAHWPPHLAVRALHAVCGLAVCWSLKVCFPTQHPFLVRFWSSLLGAHSAAYWLKMYSPLVWSLWGPMGERKTNSATVLILRIDTCLFKIKNQSLQKTK